MKVFLARIGYWLFFLFLIYVIYELARKILGGSLGYEALAIGLLLTNIGFSFYLREAIGKSETRLLSAINNVDTKMETHVGWHMGKGQ